MTSTGEATVMTEPKKPTSTRPAARSGTRRAAGTTSAGTAKKAAATEPERNLQDPIRHWIRELRIARFMSQEVLAKKAGIARETLSEYESGRREPRADTMLRIATALGVTPAWRIYDLPEEVARILIAIGDLPPVTFGEPDQDPPAPPAGPATHSGATAQAGTAHLTEQQLGAQQEEETGPPWFYAEGGDVTTLIPAFDDLPVELTAHAAQLVMTRLKAVAEQWQQNVGPEDVNAFLHSWALRNVIRKHQITTTSTDKQREAAQTEFAQVERDIIGPIMGHVIKQWEAAVEWQRRQAGGESG